MIGRVLRQRYEVLERLGEGALFQAFKARDRTLSRLIAVKVVHPQFAHDPSFRAALEHSMAEVAALSHPNIARLFETCEDDDTLFVAMEYVRGINLKERIRRIAPFTLSVAVDFAVAIGEAIQYGHSAGICHGDVRPHNVLVSPEGVVKVTDFGMGLPLAASPQAAGANLGNAAHYLAPEVSAGHPASISSDIYSLGVTLFEMLTGGPPYPGETAVGIAVRHQNDAVPSPRGLNPGVPKALEGIAMKAMQKRPADRYASVADVLGDLRSVRDALRFGKSLSWSPMADVTAAAAAREAAPVASAVRPVVWPPPVAPREPLPERQEVARMTARDQTDDRVSPVLKVAIGTVAIILIVILVVGLPLWYATITKPPDQQFPNVVGMKIEDARQAGEKINVRLIPHEEFSDKYDPGIVFWSEEPGGRIVRAGRSINVRVSKGSRMVWVPDLLRLGKDAAQDRLKKAGLSLGAVDRQFSSTVPIDGVISQDPAKGKRVDRDAPVNLTLSDGPQEPSEAATPSSGPPPETPDADAGTGDSGSARTGDGGSTAQSETFDIKFRIRRDGQGLRRVRVEYDDADGTHTALDEVHNEGDAIAQTVNVTGKSMRVRIYYGDSQTPISDRVHDLSLR